ncbi:type I polyketide synthase, partial [Methylogaea oryzae]|uniref:type I polyketide synthase n=1 Tax=Methylogaea oryzae TaxID=1295382 RepID=UPI0020D03291
MPTLAPDAVSAFGGQANARPPYQCCDIAIIGMAGRFPGAADLEAFWHNLRNGVESITFFDNSELLREGIPAEWLDNPSYVKAAGVLAGMDLFDAPFFGYTPKQARITDPQHRLFLETAWQAVENAGYDVDRIAVPVGVFAGVGDNSYLTQHLLANGEIMADLDFHQQRIANEKDFVATTTAYKLNLKGPAVTVQTACSTSLVAVHMACRSLLDGECGMALAGGASLSPSQVKGYWYKEGMIASKSGHCRAFDADADGTVGGYGVGAVLLKPLERALQDGDTIYAVIKASAINNDGAAKVGFAAPSVEGQAAAVAAAMAGLDYESIGYIEAHGTGTSLGDPVEIAALAQSYGPHTGKKGYCAIGSVKPNIGHLNAAAGIAGLIKTVLALQHGEIPPSLNFQRPNPKCGLEATPFYVNAALAPWPVPPGQKRRAGVSSFGIGGSNAHVVLEEAPPRTPASDDGKFQLVCLSAKTDTALREVLRNLAGHIEAHPDLNLADVAFTLNTGRKAFERRLALVAASLAGLRDALLAALASETLVGPTADSQCDEQASELRKLGQSWMDGENLDSPALYAGERRLRLPLPTYPSNGSPIVDPSPLRNDGTPRPAAATGKLPLDNWFYL